MKIINLNEKEVIILKSLLSEEISYLSDEAISEANEEDKKGLMAELEACKDILEQLKK